MTADLRAAQLRVLGIPCPRLQGRAPLVLFVAAAALFAMLSYGPHLRAAAPPGGLGPVDPPRYLERLHGLSTPVTLPYVRPAAISPARRGWFNYTVCSEAFNASRHAGRGTFDQAFLSTTRSPSPSPEIEAELELDSPSQAAVEEGSFKQDEAEAGGVVEEGEGEEEGGEVEEKEEEAVERRSSVWALKDCDPVQVHRGKSKHNLTGDIVLGVSWPRSGSTWLYTFIESVTGILGGSVYNETATEIFFGGSATSGGIFLLQRTKPTGLSSPRPPSKNVTFLVKTHYPWLVRGLDRTSGLQPSRLLVLVRNPVDAITSSFTYYRRKKGHENIKFRAHVRQYMMWMTFWDNYVSKLEAMSLDADSPGVPLMVLRYEDLCLHFDTVMPRLMRFLGTSVVNNETLSRLTSAPCSPVGRYFGYNLRFLSVREFDFVLKAAGDIVPRYGYGPLLRQYRERVRAAEEVLPWPPIRRSAPVQDK